MAASGLTLEASEAAERGEAVRGPRPVCQQWLDPDPADDAAQDGDDHDGVVGVAQDRDEVRDQVEGSAR